MTISDQQSQDSSATAVLEWLSNQTSFEQSSTFHFTPFISSTPVEVFSELLSWFQHSPSVSFPLWCGIFSL